MIDLIDLLYKTTRWLLLLWALFILGSVATLFISIENLDLFLHSSTPIISTFVKRLIRYRYHLLYASFQENGSSYDFSFEFLLQMLYAASITFSQYLKELFIAVFLYQAMKRYTVISFRIPPWLQQALPLYFTPDSGAIGSGEEDDPDLPPLEEVEETPLLEEAKRGEWHVFHPTFGVIPKETSDLWSRQEEEREELRLRLLQKKHLPPIRFNDDLALDTDEEDDLIAIEQAIPLERGLSGFETVGIE